MTNPIKKVRFIFAVSLALAVRVSGSVSADAMEDPSDHPVASIQDSRDWNAEAEAVSAFIERRRDLGEGLESKSKTEELKSAIYSLRVPLFKIGSTDDFLSRSEHDRLLELTQTMIRVSEAMGSDCILEDKAALEESLALMDRLAEKLYAFYEGVPLDMARSLLDSNSETESQLQALAKAPAGKEQEVSLLARILMASREVEPAVRDADQARLAYALSVLETAIKELSDAEDLLDERDSKRLEVNARNLKSISDKLEAGLGELGDNQQQYIVDTIERIAVFASELFDEETELLVKQRTE